MKTIALVDIGDTGHHLAFIKLFANSLLKLNYRVIIFYPRTEELVNIGEQDENIEIVQNDIHIRQFKSFGKFNKALKSFFIWRNTQSQLKKFEKLSRIRIDLVFFAMLDGYIINYLPPFIVDLFFKYRWSGLFFHPWYLFHADDKVSWSSRDTLLKSKYCFGVAIHDEFLIPRLQKRINSKVILFPEIADSTDPDWKYDLAIELKRRKSNKTCIGIIGLEKRKGIMKFINLVRLSDPEKYFFFLSGPLNKKGYTHSEYLSILSFLKDQRENVFYFDQYIPEGEKINAIISEVDILYLVYHNFKSSSNYSTKAALFNKAVLATNRFWIGNVTRKYSMGITVDETEDSSILNGLIKLDHLIKTKNFKPKFKEYLEVHNESNLESAFKALLLR